MRTIQINADSADQLFKEILLGDRKMIQSNIHDLLAAQAESPLPAHRLEDLVNDQQVLAAMNVLLTYYLPHEEFTKILG